MVDTVVKSPTVWTAQPLPSGQTPGHEVEHRQAKATDVAVVKATGHWQLRNSALLPRMQREGR